MFLKGKCSQYVLSTSKTQSLDYPCRFCNYLTQLHSYVCASHWDWLVGVHHFFIHSSIINYISEIKIIRTEMVVVVVSGFELHCGWFGAQVMWSSRGQYKLNWFHGNLNFFLCVFLCRGNFPGSFLMEADEFQFVWVSTFEPSNKLHGSHTHCTARGPGEHWIKRGIFSHRI